MFRKKQSKESNKVDIYDLVMKQTKEDVYILDNENAIIVVNNPDFNSKYRYLMVHQRLIDGSLVDINKWELITYYYGVKDVVLNDFNLFMVQGSHGRCGALYNYKEDRFVTKIGDWEIISSGNYAAGVEYHLPHVNYLEQYNCFLANFSINTTYQAGDIISYTHPITRERMVHSFNLTDGKYFALLNIDGTIRGNKLFKGSSFSKINEIIDLNEYKSLEDFKEKQLVKLEALKHKIIMDYLREVHSREESNISPYKDLDVMRVLQLKK